MREAVASLCVTIFLVQASLCIHIPGENVDKKTLTTLGIKTLGWQDSDGTNASVAPVLMHHNYSKVSVQNEGGSSFSQFSQSHSDFQHSTNFTSGQNQETVSFSQNQEGGFGQATIDVDDYFDLVPQVQGLDEENEDIVGQSQHTFGGQQQDNLDLENLSQFTEDQSGELQLQNSGNAAKGSELYLGQTEIQSNKQQVGSFISQNSFVGQQQDNLGSFSHHQNNFGGQKTTSFGPHVPLKRQEEDELSTASSPNSRRIYNAHSYGGSLQLDQIIESERNQQQFQDFPDYDQDVGASSIDSVQLERQAKHFYPLEKPIYVHGFKYPPDPKDVYPLNKQKPEVPPEVYTKCPKMATGQFVFALSCNQFLNCWKGRGYVQNCAPGTLFNPRTLECDFASKVQCITGPRKPKIDQNQQTAQKLETGCPAGFSGVVPHHSDCSKFINCANGIEHVMDCAPGTLFSLKINSCDFPYRAECAAWSLQFGGLKNVVTSENYHDGDSFNIHGENSYYQNGNNKHDQKYVSADDFRLQQSSGTGVNEQQGADTYGAGGRFYGSQQKVDGYSKGLSSAYKGFSENQSQQNAFGYTSGSQTGTERYGSDTDGVYSSNQNSYGTNQYGQQGQKWSYYGNSQVPGQGSHGVHSTLNQYEQTGLDQSQLNQNTHSQGYFGHNQVSFSSPSENVQQFNSQSSDYHHESAGQDSNLQGKNQNISRNQGQHTYGSGYKNQNQNIGSSGSDIKASLRCPAGATGMVPHPHDCAKFLSCANGQAFVQDCGPGTVFNPESKVCDFPYRVKCHYSDINLELVDHGASFDTQHHGQTSSSHSQYGQGSGVNFQGSSRWHTGQNSGGSGYEKLTHHSSGGKLQPSGSVYQTTLGNSGGLASGTTSSGIVKCPDHTSGLYPHPTICSKFLNCANGQTFVQDCGPGTVFNPDSKVCDFPYNVECGATHGEGLINVRKHPVTPKSTDSHGHDPQGSGTEGYHHGVRSDSTIYQQGHYGQGATNQQGFYSHGQVAESDQSQTGQGHVGTNQQGQQGFYGQGQTALGQPASYGEGQTATNQQGFYGSDQTLASHQGTYGQGQTVSNQQGIYGQGQVTTSHQDSYGVRGTTTGHQYLYGHGHTTTSHQGTQAQGQIAMNQQGTYGQSHSVSQQGFYGHGKPPTAQQSIYDQGQVTDADQDLEETHNFNQKPLYGLASTQNQTGSVNQQTHYGHTQFESQNSLDSTRFGSSKPHSLYPFPSTDLNADYEFGNEETLVKPEPSAPKLPKLQRDGNRKRKDFCEIQDFRCSIDDCIQQSMVCDGIKDCSSGIDEQNCEKYLKEFTVTPNAILAVREKERFLNISLTYCAKTCLQSRGFQCKSFSYRKADGTCFLCDSNVGQSGALIISYPYDYYEVTSLSTNCTGLYKCPNQKCISFQQVCDGINDCGDRIDEKGCSAEAFGYQIKLGGTDKKHEGRIELKAFGKWGYVCDDKFGLRDADVVCRELGFPLGSLEVKANSYYAQDLDDKDVFYMMDDVTCLGNETSIRDCDFNGWGVNNCEAQEVVGVVCKTPQEECPKDTWKCDTVQECLPLAFVCDGVFDCSDQSDEGSQHCDTPTEFRLANGNSKSEGRLEVRHNGIWGTVCDDDFNDDAAKVICKYLGYPGKAIAKKDGFFGPGSGPIWLDQVFCQGNESALHNCVHWNWGEHNCEHTEDVGIVCSNIHNNYTGSPKNVKIGERHSVIDPLPLALFPARCGLRKDDQFLEKDEVHFRVVKGSVARKGDYPWQASLRIKNKSNPTLWCGAVVISQKFVLTAAHCLVGFSKGAYFVVAGDYNTDEEEGTEQEAYIEEFYIHQEFRNGQKMNNDIALVKLKGDGFIFSKDLQPICLPEADLEYQQGMNCTISGFGSVQSGKSGYSHELRAGWIPMQSKAICQMPHVYGTAVTDGMICAGSLDEGIDACDGDSGGPLACLHEGYYTLYGLTSWGQHCGHANKPGVYVKVSHYRKWIDDTIKKHS